MSAGRSDLAEGDIVHVIMEYRRPISGTDSVQCYVRDPAYYSFVSVPIPVSQIVRREPAGRD